MSRIYFDKSSFSQLWRDSRFDKRQLKRVRSRLSSNYFARRPKVVVGPSLISEIAPLRGSSQFDLEIEFLQILPDAICLKPMIERIQDEVEAWRGGYPPEPFMPNGALGAMLASPEELWKAERLQAQANQETFHEEDSVAQREMTKALPDAKERSELLKRWAENREEVVAEWAGDYMKRNATQFGLSAIATESAWPQPQDLRTVWGFASYRVAHIFVQLRDNRKNDGNDLVDWGHYMVAMYADLLVVDDSKFTEIVKNCPSPAPLATTFQQWAKEFLT